MEFLRDIISQPVMQKIGWVLVHSIWQCAAIAIVLAVVLKMLKKSSSNTRYVVCCCALVAMVLVPAVTFCSVKVETITEPVVQKTPVLAVTPVKQIKIDLPEAKIVQAESIPVETKQSLKEKFINTVEPILPYAVLGWLSGIFILSIWYLGGWTQLQKLRRRMIKKVPYEINVITKKLRSRLQIQRAINIAESALVEVPTVIGHLKPIILFPTSAFTGLSTDQLEAIIAHELAHIKRCDYLVNIFQTAIEIIGFYHPAVWWTSAKIRSERENCCDDIAVSITTDKICYASALATMEEIRSQRPALAVAANGGDLFNRIRRLLMNDNNTREKSPLPSILIFVLITFLAISVSLAVSSTKETKSLATDPTEITTDRELNLSLTVPANWKCNKEANPGKYRFLWNIATDLPNSDILFIGTNVTEKMADTARQIAIEDIAILKDYFDNYKVRENSWQEDVIANLPSAKYVADFVYDNKQMVEYRTYILDKKMVYWFVFRVDKKWFEKNKSQFDSVANSLRLNIATEDTENTEVKNGIDITAADFKFSKNNRGVYELTVSIKNDSDVTIPKFKLRYYRGDVKDNLDEAGNPHSGWHNAGPIEPGKQWNECSGGFSLPDGRYKFSAVLDYPNEIDEADENNNQISTSVNILGGKILENADYARLEAENLISEGWKLWRQRKLFEAEKTFKQATEKDPQNDGAWQGLGWAQFNQGKKLNAQKSFEKCIKLNPKNSAALNGLGWLAHGQKDTNKAIQWWQNAVEVSGGYATASLSGLTQVYTEKGDYENAIKYYKMWLKAEPDNTKAKEGLEKIEAAKSKKPTHPIDFEITRQNFLPGDSIEITQLLGTTGKIEVGQTYTVKGKYKLISANEAMLHVYATNGQVDSPQGANIKRGQGDFSRTFTLQQDGYPHLSFYPAGGGEGFGGIYFAQKNLIKKNENVYVVNFRPKNRFNPQNPGELLKPFNDAVKFRVKTHHFRTKNENGILTGYMLCDSSAEQKAIELMLADSDKIEFVKAELLSEDKLAKYYASKQESLTKKPINNLKSLLKKPVTVNINNSPDGNRLTVQYAVIEICKVAGVQYNWKKSAKLADPQRRNFIEPVNIKNVPADKAILDIIKPVGLNYRVDTDSLYLYRTRRTK